MLSVVVGGFALVALVMCKLALNDITVPAKLMQQGGGGVMLICQVTQEVVGTFVGILKNRINEVLL